MNLIDFLGFILKREFAKFSKSDLVMLCPLYAAGEKKNKKFTQVGFENLYQPCLIAKSLSLESQRNLKLFKKTS